MRPVGTQSRFTTPLDSLLFLPLARLLISASGFAIAQGPSPLEKEFHSVSPRNDSKKCPGAKAGALRVSSLFLPVWKKNQSGVICFGLFCFRQNVANAYTD